MKSRNAIVTGSTSGIGLAVAETLAQEGCNILLNGFADSPTVDAISQRLQQQFSVQVSYSGADMSKPDEIVAMIEACNETFGSVDILVNNAGIQHTDAVDDFPIDKWDQILAINLSSSFHTIRSALPLMKANGFGRIVNMASVHGLVASINKSAYVAAKHGLVGLTKVVALETAGTAVTCNSVCPGWVRTPLVEKQINDLAAKAGIPEDEAITQLLGPKQPSKNFVTPRQIGQAVAYLCSESASEIRGTSLNIDGGWLAQ